MKSAYLALLLLVFKTFRDTKTVCWVTGNKVFFLLWLVQKMDATSCSVTSW